MWELLLIKTLSIKTSKEKHGCVGHQNGLFVVLKLLDLLALIHGVNTGVDDVVPLVAGPQTLSVGPLNDI